MYRQQTYVDRNVNPFVASQMERTSAQRRQPGAGMDNFPGCLSLEEQHLYKPAKLEGQWKWDRDASKVLNQMPLYSFNQGEGDYGARSHYYGQTRNSFDNPANKENNLQTQEQEMEIGYGDSPSPAPSTFEGLEGKFHGEIVQLVKEQSEAEDAENVRHREKVIEINTMYQEKLSALRAQHASQREEFLCKESKSWLYQYRQAGISHYQNSGLQDTRGYTISAVATATGETTYRGYVSSQFESYREQPEYVAGRALGTEARVPYPEGRVYNGSTRYY